jgi:hypothetical protein
MNRESTFSLDDESDREQKIWQQAVRRELKEALAKIERTQTTLPNREAVTALLRSALDLIPVADQSLEALTDADLKRRYPNHDRDDV